MSAQAELAAGIVFADGRGVDRVLRVSDAADVLAQTLGPSALWHGPGNAGAAIPSDLRGAAAYGDELPRWRSMPDITPDERTALAAAWDDAAAPDGGGARGAQFLRLRVDSAGDVRRLRAIADVNQLLIVPSLDSRGRRRPFEWRWPLSVGVAPGPRAQEWLAQIRDSSHHGMVFDAELCDPTGKYDIAVVSFAELPALTEEWLSLVGDVPCVIVAGTTSAEQMLQELESTLEPAIAVAFGGDPAEWWNPLLDEMCHDLPIDVAVEIVARHRGTDALMAGPRRGLDITASAHWFAAVAPDVPELEAALAGLAAWDWTSEGGGTTAGARIIRRARDSGADPHTVILAGTRSIPFPPSVPVEMTPSPPPASTGAIPLPPPASTGAIPLPPPTSAGEAPSPPPVPVGAERPGDVATTTPPADEQRVRDQPRRLVARVWDGEAVVDSVLPPARDLRLAVRIALPERGDVGADEPAPSLSFGEQSTVELQVAVRSDVWDVQPAPQKISVSRDKPAVPSSWAVFPFSTPAEGGLVSVEIVLLYRGKPLQAATYVSPVRSIGLPGERPTLITFALSGPDEPTEDLRPVAAHLDGRRSDLVHLGGHGGAVTISDVQDKLDAIEDRVSRVLGVTGAPDSFEDERAVTLLISLARLGSELTTLLEPLHLGNASSINMLVNPQTPVLPLELAYAGPPPDPQRARLCAHITEPPPLGEACARVSTRIVCPYAFWGLHRSIARTVASEEEDGGGSPTASGAASTILYAATVIADDGAPSPKPTDTVLVSAEQTFRSVTRVTSWRAWRKAVRTVKPDLLVVLGHTLREGSETRLYIGKRSSIARVDISAALLRSEGSPKPLVLLIACSSAALGDSFGTLPGALTAKGAGAVVGTLSKIVGPQGAAATVQLLQALHEAEGKGSVGDAVAVARYALVGQKRPIGLLLVSHGELDSRVGS
ncbi:MAG TPA: hypothetical protein VFY91_18100 [Microbacterium sp.]|nr:hypothetical protein [Microbacterium sp.]